MTGKLVASTNSGNSQNVKLEAGNGHIIFMSPAAILHMEKVYSIGRQEYGRSATEDVNDLDVNNAVCVYSRMSHFITVI